MNYRINIGQKKLLTIDAAPVSPEIVRPISVNVKRSRRNVEATPLTRLDEVREVPCTQLSQWAPPFPSSSASSSSSITPGQQRRKRREVQETPNEQQGRGLKRHVSENDADTRRSSTYSLRDYINIHSSRSRSFQETEGLRLGFDPLGLEMDDNHIGDPRSPSKEVFDEGEGGTQDTSSTSRIEEPFLEWVGVAQHPAKRKTLSGLTS